MVLACSRQHPHCLRLPARTGLSGCSNMYAPEAAALPDEPRLLVSRALPPPRMQRYDCSHHDDQVADTGSERALGLGRQEGRNLGGLRAQAAGRGNLSHPLQVVGGQGLAVRAGLLAGRLRRSERQRDREPNDWGADPSRLRCCHLFCRDVTADEEKMLDALATGRIIALVMDTNFVTYTAGQNVSRATSTGRRAQLTQLTCAA